MVRTSSCLAGLILCVGLLSAVEPDSAPRPVPLTRPEMKQYLEDMKARKPRFQLPPLTEEEKAKLGERGAGYESRLRALYMPTTGATNSFGFGREADPSASLDNAFKVELFWIVSRANNCQYCLGHQESKLLNAGLKEDEIAALDCDWSQFAPAQQAAFAFARKFTNEPHTMTDSDIAGLRKHYNDFQILEMILSMAGNNAINRWKEGVGVPQSANGGIGIGRRTENPPAARPADEKHSYLTPTAERFKDKITTVAPLRVDEKNGKPTRETVCDRPVLESPAEVERALAACRQRKPRLPLVDKAKTRELLGAEAPQGALPQWMLLLANFPRDGKSRIISQRSAEEKGDLTPLLKAQVSWIIARQDRAWYATGQAKRRLHEQGWSDARIYKLDGDWADFAPTERALFTVARKLAASPVVLTDEDVAQAVRLAGPRDVVQLISLTTTQASFNRITEAAGLSLEP